jgi:hypothetical protein
MKNTLYAAAAILFLAATVITGCEDSGDKLDRAKTSFVEASRDLNMAKSEVQAEIELFRNDNASKLAVNERSIAQIRTLIGKQDMAARTAFERKVSELDRNNRDLKSRLDNYNDSLSINWTRFKSDFNSDMDKLNNALQDFFPIETSID